MSRQAQCIANVSKLASMQFTSNYVGRHAGSFSTTWPNSVHSRINTDHTNSS